MVERFEHFTFAVNEINRFLRKLSGEEMEKLGLKASHAVYFTVLSKNEENGLTATQLCEYCVKDKADVSRMIAVMEKKGLVIKQGVNQNLYNGVLKLTEDGKKIAERVKQKAEKAVEIAGKDLSTEERRIFYKALDSIVENMRELSMKGIPE